MLLKPSPWATVPPPSSNGQAAAAAGKLPGTGWSGALERAVICPYCPLVRTSVNSRNVGQAAVKPAAAEGAAVAEHQRIGAGGQVRRAGDGRAGVRAPVDVERQLAAGRVVDRGDVVPGAGGERAGAGQRGVQAVDLPLEHAGTGQRKAVAVVPGGRRAVVEQRLRLAHVAEVDPQGDGQRPGRLVGGVFRRRRVGAHLDVAAPARLQRRACRAGRTAGDKGRAGAAERAVVVAQSAAPGHPTAALVEQPPGGGGRESARYGHIGAPYSAVIWSSVSAWVKKRTSAR